VREPSVHRAVTELSVSLSQKIVERRGRRVVLTARGAALARRFSLAEAELNSAIAELQRLHGQEVGRIALGAMPLSRAKLLPDTISKFHRLHPTVNVAVVEGSHAELLGPLMNGEIDIMIGALRSSVAPDLTQRPLFVDRPVILARSGHPLVSHGASTTTEQLAQFPWVVPALETPLRTQWAQMFETSGIRPPPVAIECGSVLVIRQLLMENDFLTLLSPTQVAVELEAGWLATVCAAPGDPARTIGVTVRTDWCPTHFQRSFLDLIDAQAKTLQSHNT
jgi:DNA-binding transcriptional LysR family regulator